MKKNMKGSKKLEAKMNDPVVEEFINSQSKRGTFFTYKSQMKLYLEFIKKTGAELLEIKRNDKDFQVEKSMLELRKWLLEKGKSQCYATSTIGCVRGFYGYYRAPLRLRRQELEILTESARKTADYLFDRDDLAKMALAGSLKERYVLLTGKSVGLRASDFLRFTYGQFRSLKLDSEPPIPIGEIATIKEKIKAYPFLDSDAAPIVKAWLEGHQKEPDDARIIDDDESNLTQILITLCKKAGMEVDVDKEGKPLGTIHGKRIRFHSLRKFLIDRLSAHAGESQWKQFIGKAIDEGAYISQDQLRGIYQRAMKDTLINGNGVKAKKLIEIENAMSQLERENAAFKTRIDGLQKQTQEMDDQLKNINSVIDFIRIEDAIRFVSAKSPSQEEMLDYLKRRQVDPAILKRAELSCLTYSQQTKRWHYLPELDVYKIGN
ncbi:MAG: hypothetical protein ABSB71_08450 [Candidatus Bathyarchaeia archaeon]